MIVSCLERICPFHHPTVEMQKVLMSGVDEKGIEDIFYNNAKKFFDV